MPETPPAPKPEPVPERRADPAPRFEPAPAVDIDRALKESGLQLVETKSKGPVAHEEPAFVPAKRERRPAPASEPMVQVETGRGGEEKPPA
jgi:hypothetical protein